ncbi:MAG: alpha/beta hydrolase [Nitrososphaeria archaeon]|jgi:pimeloyl-ACP methyl ester carboxylesterase
MWAILEVFVLTLVGLGLLVTAFIWIYAPFRAKNLSKKYEKFRADFQATHDKIDAQFNHQDRVVNGIQWHYVDEGNPDGEVILFLHGLPEGWYSWRYVLPQVDHSYRLIAIDMKGYGRSDLKDRNYNWHVVAEQTVKLMDSLGIKKFYLVSHDWGTIIGSVLVSDHPERIRGYVRMEADLIQKWKDNRGKIAGYIQKPQWLLFQNNWIATYMMQNSGWFIDFVYKRRMTTPFNLEDRDYLVYEFSRPGVANMNPKYFLSSNWDLDTAIGKICKNNFPFPVLQLQADSDPAQPPSIFADVATKCPNVQMEWVRNASHFDNFDQPTQIADAINRFIHSSNR